MDYLTRKNLRQRSNLGAVSQINITPMIDVMTVLLAVFMVTAPLLTSGVNVDLPKGGKGVLKGDNKTIDITVDVNGRIYIGKSKISINKLIPKIKSITKANPSIGIVISGDTNSAYGNVVGVMAKLKDAGFTKVGLKTQNYGTPKKKIKNTNKAKVEQRKRSGKTTKELNAKSIKRAKTKTIKTDPKSVAPKKSTKSPFVKTTTKQQAIDNNAKNDAITNGQKKK